jgi:hypothetical protein
MTGAVMAIASGAEPVEPAATFCGELKTPM